MMGGITIDTADEFRLYLRGYYDGAAMAWRTLADLVRAGVPDGTLAYVVTQMAERHPRTPATPTPR